MLSRLRTDSVCLLSVSHFQQGYSVNSESRIRRRLCVLDSVSNTTRLCVPGPVEIPPGFRECGRRFTGTIEDYIQSIHILSPFHV